MGPIPIDESGPTCSTVTRLKSTRPRSIGMVTSASKTHAASTIRACPGPTR
jgi:hypothetical protein